MMLNMVIMIIPMLVDVAAGSVFVLLSRLWDRPDESQWHGFLSINFDIIAAIKSCSKSNVILIVMR